MGALVEAGGVGKMLVTQQISLSLPKNNNVNHRYDFATVRTHEFVYKQSKKVVFLLWLSAQEVEYEVHGL